MVIKDIKYSSSIMNGEIATFKLSLFDKFITSYKASNSLVLEATKAFDQFLSALDKFFDLYKELTEYNINNNNKIENLIEENKKWKTIKDIEDNITEIFIKNELKGNNNKLTLTMGLKDIFSVDPLKGVIHIIMQIPTFTNEEYEIQKKGKVNYSFRESKDNIKILISSKCTKNIHILLIDAYNPTLGIESIPVSFGDNNSLSLKDLLLIRNEFRTLVANYTQARGISGSPRFKIPTKIEEAILDLPTDILVCLE
ncbi:17103_t:CDS:2 [Funneliformis caledonium]|uniref:17103_t:CDS:1 n=1 Tax=Funneliformis caledonium TaxID=1117310 RepID=A0A9N9ALQ2_9GLOM|nr:17103_t:CDS:2 [Funneliformis caledonium]